jgi:hypothetical protein
MFRDKKYGRIYFANGTYALKDLPLISGWEYKLDPFTLIVPHRDADFAFTTIGTRGVVPGDPTWQRLMYCEINGGVIGDYWKETGDVPVGAGGINLLYGSYVRLRNIAIRHIRGIAIYGGELFDSPLRTSVLSIAVMMTQTIMHHAYCLTMLGAMMPLTPVNSISSTWRPTIPEVFGTNADTWFLIP